MKRNIILLEPDKEQQELFSNWLIEVGYSVTAAEVSAEVVGLLKKEKYDLIIVDLDTDFSPETIVDLCRSLKENEVYKDIPITALTFKKDTEKVATSIGTGVDRFILKPFETEYFCERIDAIFKEIELKKSGKKSIDTHYIEYLTTILHGMDRESFFVLAPVIFNKTIVEKINSIIGDPIIAQVIKRLSVDAEDELRLMNSTKFINGRLSMADMEQMTKDASVEDLIEAYRKYINEFFEIIRALTSNILY